MQQDDRVAVAVVLVVHRRAQYIHVGHDFLSSRRLRSMGRPSSVTDSLCQPLVTIGASRRSQSEQKRWATRREAPREGCASGFDADTTSRGRRARAGRPSRPHRPRCATPGPAARRSRGGTR
jgi:hypothetical protein